MSRLNQKLELSSQGNIGLARHGWLRITPAFSRELAQQLLGNIDNNGSICDPFSGSGTTVLSSAMQGKDSFGVDVNPFLVWLGKTKVAKYKASDFVEARAAAECFANTPATQPFDAPELPKIHNIDRWWSQESLAYLAQVKVFIEKYEGHRRVKDLLKLAFCRVILSLANTTRRHQSLSFKLQTELLPLDEPFSSALDLILNSCGNNPEGKAKIIVGDSKLPSAFRGVEIENVVTSPPYPNRYTMLRELRPLMYWLSYFEDSTQAGELDLSAIGGTWGKATSRLRSWKPSTEIDLPKLVLHTCERIRLSESRVEAKSSAKNPLLMANYVHRYFEDMARHFEAMKPHIRKGGKLIYVVGNSSFYGNLVESDRLFVQLLTSRGFRGASAKVLRKRSSKSVLYEFVIQAKL